MVVKIDSFVKSLGLCHCEEHSDDPSSAVACYGGRKQSRYFRDLASRDCFASLAMTIIYESIKLMNP